MSSLVMHSELLDLAASQEPGSLDFLRNLLRIPSVWGDADRLTEAATLIAEVLRDAGLDVSLPDSGTDGMPMVLARLQGSGSGRNVVFNGHMEVYPPSESWTLDPWGAHLRDGRLYGQGAADMKAGTAAMTAACALLGRSGVQLPGDVVLLAIPNHFEGGEGTRKAIRDGLTADAAIVCEPSDLAVLNGQRGILYLTITVRGRAAHTTALGIGVNAIERAARVILALRDYEPRDATGTPTGAEKILNVAMIEGGVVHNLVPESCRITVDIRFPPEQTQADVLADVERAIRTALGDDYELPTTVEPEPTCLRNPRSALRLPEHHPLVASMLAAHEAANGAKTQIGFHSAWPDTPVFNEAGIPAVTYGPGSVECYWDDEWVTIDDYLAAIRTYCVAAAELTTP